MSIETTTQQDVQVVGVVRSWLLEPQFLSQEVEAREMLRWSRKAAGDLCLATP